MTTLETIYFLSWFLIPAGIAIGWPLARYRKTKADGYITMSIIHGIVGGIGASYVILCVVMNGMLTYVWVVPLFACSFVALIDVIRVRIFER